MRALASFFALLMFVVPAAAQQLPACNSQLLTRHGDQVNMSMAALSRVFNKRLRAAKSGFSDLKLTPGGDNHLKISGKKNGTPMSISGPLQVTSNGELQLHAQHIRKGGSGVKGLMDLFGQNLSDYMNLKHAKSLSVQGNTLHINADKLLGVDGKVSHVTLKNGRIIMQFSSQPCQ